MNEFPNYDKIFKFLVVNKTTDKYMTDGMFIQALKNKDIVIMDDGDGFLILFSRPFSVLYKSTDFMIDSESK